MFTLGWSSESEWVSRMRDLNKKLARFIDLGRKQSLELSGFDCEVIIEIIRVLERNEDSLKARLDKATKDVEKSVGVTQVLENELKKARVKIQELQALVNEQEEENDKLRRELEELQDHVEYLKQQLDPKNAELKKVKEDLKIFLADYKVEKEKKERILRQIRSEYEKKIEKLRRDLTEEHTNEIDGLKTEYKHQTMQLISRIEELELQLKKEGEKIRKLRKRTVSSREIDYYAELLEAEEIEVRLNEHATNGENDVTPQRPAQRRRRGREPKNPRRRLQFDECNSGQVTIEKVDRNGESIKLHNKANKNQSMRGWQLIHKGDDGEEVTFEFPDTYVLKKNSDVTIWGSRDVGPRRPPSHLVLISADSWGSWVNTQKTTLVNQAQKVIAMTTSHVQPETQGFDDGRYEDPDRDEDVDSDPIQEDAEDDGPRRICKVM